MADQKNREICTYTIPTRVVEFCRLGGRRAITHITLRRISPEDLARAAECSSGDSIRATLILLQFALHAIQIEDEPMRTLDPASDDPELRTAEVYKTLPPKIRNLMALAFVEHLLPRNRQAA